MWNDVPDEAESEDVTLYRPFVVHINAILLHFQLINRSAVLSHGTNIPHLHEPYETKITSKPDICLLAYGPGFAKAQKIPDKATYDHCAAPIEVKTEKGLKESKDRKQLAVYARECFVQQPNRRFVYGLLLTEKRVQVYQFDRGGVWYSKWYDIRIMASTFVEIILGIASSDETHLGLDTRIFWDGDRRYFEDPGAVNIRYTISHPDRPFRRRTIRGRGTTCWTVTDLSGKEYMLKFSWKSKDRVGEWDYLQRIKNANLKHVGIMESYRKIEQLSSIRPGVSVNHEDFTEREYYYTLQPFYGPPIEKFTSVLQLYRAFRDAISGVMELLRIGILHRDISLRNILLDRREGKDGGGWGILIDFDMAISLDRNESQVKTDFRTGTRAFQSYKVLHGLGVHDHLDELESCFYVFSWLVFTFRGPRVSVHPLPHYLEAWESGDMEATRNSKRAFLTDASA
ncbi:hypothetical protein NEOLEDRAFT_1078111, partial [Neolentinus lepideus HHB14362 ss-1]